MEEAGQTKYGTQTSISGKGHLYKCMTERPITEINDSLTQTIPIYKSDRQGYILVPCYLSSMS